MAVQQFDELNTLRGYAEIWFEKTQMPENARKKRVDLCMNFTELMLLLFYMITEQELEDFEYVPFLKERLVIIANNYIGVDNIAYVNNWAEKQAKIIIDNTLEMYEGEIEDETAENEEKEAEAKKKEREEHKQESQSNESRHFEEFDVDIPNSQYPTSKVRALLLAIECTTSVSNYADYYDAVKSGKTRKVWMTLSDNRVRESHILTQGQERPINMTFNVNGSEMIIPGDLTYDPDMKEIYNCRCYCEYY